MKLSTRKFSLRINPIATLCAHAGRHLPDSLRERKTVLRAMERVLHAGNPVHRQVQAQLAGLAAVERLDVQLKLNLLGRDSEGRGH